MQKQQTNSRPSKFSFIVQQECNYCDLEIGSPNYGPPAECGPKRPLMRLSNAFNAVPDGFKKTS